MCLLYFSLRRVCLAAALIASATAARSVSLDQAGAPGADPARCSMTIVENHPAVAWADVKNNVVKYVRALDTTGSAWGAPVTLDTGSFLAGICLRTVNGNPAVCYFDNTLNRLKFTRASDAAGNSWDPPVAFDGGLLSGGITMEVVNGNPAVAFPTQNAGLRYMRALNANGSAWGPASTIDIQSRTGNPSMKLVEGRPAIAWPSQSSARFVRANDDTGVIWGTPKIIGFSPGLGLANHCSLQIVGGRPAISFSVGDSTVNVGSQGTEILYSRSTDSSGAAWNSNARVVVNQAETLLRHPSLEVINGKPAIAFLEGAPFFDLKLVHSTDTTGSAWQVPLTLDSTGGTGFYPSLLMVSKAPAIAYYDCTPGSVKYLRADNADGTLWPADIVVGRQGTTTVIPDGGTAVFPIAAPGGTARFDFKIWNPNSGSGELNITNLTIDGPDAAEFSVISPPPDVLAAGATAGLIVQHAPVSQGRKTAVLHITSSAENPRQLYDITLTNHAENPVPGTRDPSFNPVALTISPYIAVQADGKILTAFLKLLTRFHPDGSPDTSFFAPPLNAGITCLAVQKDGRILVGGSFSQIAGRIRAGLARLNSDGSLDDSFNPGTEGIVLCVIIQPDGKILAGTADHSSGNENLRRFHPDGSPDSSFASIPRGAPVECLALQPDGKILVGGRFTEISSAPAPGLARLNADGTRDTFAHDFAALFDVSINGPSAITVQPDGGIIVTGRFEGGLARLFPDGRLNGATAYVSGINQGISTAMLQADGKSVVNGYFTTFGGVSRHNLARMQPDGTVDADFQPFIFHPFSEYDYDLIALMQADGRVLISGFFHGVDDMTQPHLARLENDTAVNLLQTSGTSTIRWLRGGAAAEVRDVTFDIKTDKSPDWTGLGSAHRIPGGWELTGLTLPASGQIRAQAYAGGSVAESVAPILTGLDSWRIQYFNSAHNTGDAADDADPDQDGLTNFTEFAFGLSPVDRNSNALPEFKHNGTSLTASFHAPEGRENLIYSAQWSETMQADTWTEIPDTGTGGAHTFHVPGGKAKAFVRFTVGMPSPQP
ncbi:MAG TPA: hypothetical protein VG796_13145 [Verrucomicrobiales bacterium]|jgi:uncharacterized delta-60 repeat protein|nr:hypothetical protein [Verrucomicrobiales bacterium]